MIQNFVSIIEEDSKNVKIETAVVFFARRNRKTSLTDLLLRRLQQTLIFF
jgi:hypothetical protein